MFYRLGHFAAYQSWFVCAAWLVLGIALTYAAPPWDATTQDDDVRFVPERFTSVRAYHTLQEAFPDDVFACRVVFALERAQSILRPEDFVLAEAIIKDIERLRDAAPELKIGKIDSFQSGLVGWRMISNDQQCTLIQVSLGTPYLAIGTQQAVERMDAVVKKRLELTPPGGLQVYTTGSAGIGRDLTKAAGDSLDHTTWATVILVIVVLLCVYRAPLLALVPLLTIAISVWVSLKLLAIMTLVPGVHLVSISKIFAIVILYGAGTDYCLFLISRYREELETGLAIGDALAKSVEGVGEALAASAGTVMVGLGLMATAEFAKVRCAGPAIALSLGVALLASLTLTPALLSLVGRWVFWPGAAPAPGFRARLADVEGPPEDLGLWDKISQLVARRPIAVWFAAVVILIPFILLGFRVQPNYRATGELSPDCASLKGLSAIQRHFNAGEIGPTTVLLTSTKDWASPLGQAELERLSFGFSRIEGVAEVRSLVQPVGFPFLQVYPNPDSTTLFNRMLMLLQPALQSWHDEVVAEARSHYVAEVQSKDESGNPRKVYVTKLDVIFKTDPFDPASAKTLKTIQTWLRNDMPSFNFMGEHLKAECYGITAVGMDLAEVTESDRHRVNGYVLAAILLILLILVRRVWLAVYLLVTVLASYYAALGATALAGLIWQGHILTHVDWRVPFFLFTILVAVGEDYNILLIARALEERKKHGPVEGMRRALAKTGGAITSCGLIMAGTFATLMLAGLNTLMQIGFALAFGVLVDTFIVRPFLVPACAIIFWGGQKDEPADAEAPAPADAPTLKQAA
ncbi:MAG: MMPL family transporter [Planctomycetes bacterium]|nr:MMPL family transporter [Planctomycetota bacterium]